MRPTRSAEPDPATESASSLKPQKKWRETIRQGRDAASAVARQQPDLNPELERAQEQPRSEAGPAVSCNNPLFPRTRFIAGAGAEVSTRTIAAVNQT